MTDLDDQLIRNVTMVAAVMLVAIVVVFFFSSRLQRTVSQPILQLASIAQKISAEPRLFDASRKIRQRRTGNAL